MVRADLSHPGNPDSMSTLEQRVARCWHESPHVFWVCVNLIKGTRMKQHALFRIALAAATVFSTAFTTAISLAQVPSSYGRLGMIDFDQRWSVLPNEGNMYCVPTAYLNLLEYMENNGLDAMAGVEESHVGTYTFGTMVDAIWSMGVAMNTNPVTGTGSSTSFPAFQQMVTHGALYSGAILTTNYYGPGWDWGTSFIRSKIAMGSLITAGFGRYRLTKIGGQWGWYRDGGHAFVINGYDYRSNPLKLRVTNPANGNGDNSLESQSEFHIDTVETKNITLTTFEHGVVAHAMFSLDQGSDGNLRRVIDSMTQVFPAAGGWSGLTSQTQRLQTGGASLRSMEETIKVVVPFQFERAGLNLPSSYEVAPAEPVVDWVFEVGELAVYYVTHLGRIFRVDLLEPQHHKLLHVIKGAKKLVLAGSTLDLYALATERKGDRVYQIDRDSNQIHSVQLPQRAVGIEYDPVSGGPAVLLESLTHMLTLSENLDEAQLVELPSLENGPGNVIFKLDHQTGNVFLSRAGFNHVHVRLRVPDPRSEVAGIYRSMQFPGSSIQSFIPTEGGWFIVQHGDTIQTYDNAGGPVVSQFSGIRVDGVFKMSRSHIAGNLAAESGPGFENIWPPDAN